MTAHLKKIPFYNWYNLPKLSSLPDQVGRMYIGNETCEKGIPDSKKASELCRPYIESGWRITIVTPILSNTSLVKTLNLIGHLSEQHAQLEIVFNDYGLLHAAHGRFRCELIAGRLLACQRTDPRIVSLCRNEPQTGIEKKMHHLEGFLVHRKHRSACPGLKTHLRQSPLDCPETLALLYSYGVKRFEINNLLQGIDLDVPHNWRISIHIPEVLISIARDCTFFSSRICSGAPESLCYTRFPCLRPNAFPVTVFRRGNAWYYQNPVLPDNINSLGIDRLLAYSPTNHLA